MAESAGRQRGLVLFLRIMGTIDLFAVVAILMPLEWMAKIHSWFGIGPLPEGPLIDYLTRSASALYALHGAILLFVSTDVQRYTPLIRFMAVAALVHGVVLYLIDSIAGLPMFWIALEGPIVVASGVIVLMVQRQSNAS